MSVPRDVQPGLDRFGGRNALIALVVGVAGHNGHADLVDFDIARPLEATAVQYESDIDDIRPPWQAADDILGVRHLRNALGVHETGDLHAPDARVDRPAHELNFCVRREDLRLALQTVAGADFYNRDFSRLVAHRGLLSQRENNIVYEVRAHTIRTSKTCRARATVGYLMRPAARLA